LIDAHVHAHEAVGELQQVLKFGVTTVLDIFSESAFVRAMKETVKDTSDVADFKSSCYGATVKDGWPKPVIMISAGNKVTFTVSDRYEMNMLTISGSRDDQALAEVEEI
jgi:hypothetical protein